MKEEIASLSKLQLIKDDDFREKQGYFNDKSIENGRMSFKILGHMLEDIPGNFKNKIS